MIFYTVFPNSFNLGNSSASVTVGGTPRDVSEYAGNAGPLAYIRLLDPIVPGASQIVVELSNIINPVVPGTYQFEFFRTAEGSGAALDTPVSFNDIEIVAPPGTPFSGAGAGTSGDPYQITTCTQLQEMENNLHADYVLSNDIDCAESASWNVNLDEWEGGDTNNPLIPDSYASTTQTDIIVENNGYFGFSPVGTEGGPFTGTLNGNGNEISNLWIFRKDTDYVGLFGSTYGADIYNLSLVNSSIVGSDSTGGLVGYSHSTDIYDVVLSQNLVRAYLSYYGGGLAGLAESGSYFYNITNTNGTVHGSGNVIGGLVGSLFNSELKDSTTSANVDGGYKVGGAIGETESGTIENVRASGSVLSNHSEYGITKTGQYAGGLIGYMGEDTNVSDSFASGEVTSQGYEAGGFAGGIRQSSVTNSSSTGSVTSEEVTVNGNPYQVSSIGGFAGSIQESELVDTSAYGNVSAPDSENVGGFVGQSSCGSSFLRSFATGDVTGSLYVGGFTGSDGCEGPGSSFEEVFALGAVSGAEHVGGFGGNLSISVIADAYSRGNVSGDAQVGGFIGSAYSGTTTNAYSTGFVTGTETLVGGFIGENAEGTMSIGNSFWDGDTTDQTDSCGNAPDCEGVVEKASLELKNQVTFGGAGWNFQTVWGINDVDNDGYPFFQYQDFEYDPESEDFGNDNDIPGGTIYEIFKQELDVEDQILWTSVSASSDGLKLVAVGTGYLEEIESQAGLIYTSVDGGETWERKMVAEGGFINSVVSSSDGDSIAALGVFAINEGSTFEFVLSKSVDGGENWDTQVLHTVNAEDLEYLNDQMLAFIVLYLSRITASNDFSQIYVSLYDRVLHSDDYAETWEEAIDLSFPSSEFVFPLSISTSGDGSKVLLAMSPIVSGDSEITITLLSEDYGNNWEPVELPQEDVAPFSVTVSEDGTRLFVVDVTTQTMYISADAGQTWSTRVNPDGNTWTYVAPSATGESIIASAIQNEDSEDEDEVFWYRTVIYSSRDNGETWVKEDESEPKSLDGFLDIVFAQINGTIASSYNLSYLGLASFSELFVITREEATLPESEKRSRGGSSGSRKVKKTETPRVVSSEAPKPVGGYTFTRSLEVGSTGSDVKMLQQFLNQNGFIVATVGAGSPGSETEVFGPATRSALIRFQTTHGIVPALGYFGPVTQAFIAAYSPATSLPSSSGADNTNSSTAETGATSRNLEQGMSGSDVVLLQETLIKRGYSIGAGATGYFGQQTKDALIKYQIDKGIVPALGYFGPVTQASMR
jgi:peptidoglycan hydrolase-like protein with peptidoglycan-binding domain